MDEGSGLNIQLNSIIAEELHLGFADSLPYAVFVDFDGCIIYCNRAGASLIGFKKPEDIIGRFIREFVHPEFLNEYNKLAYSEFEKDKSHPVIESKIVKLDGTIIDVEIGASPFAYRESIGVYSIVRDITEPNKIKKSLQKSEEKYRTLVEMLPDYICLSSGGKIQYANMAAILDLGCKSLEDIVGREITDFVTPYPANNFNINTYERELKKKGYIAVREECYIRKSNGEIMPRETTIKLIPNSDEPIYLIISRDISERKKTEEIKRGIKKRKKELDDAVEYDKLRTEFFTNISHEFRTPLNVMLSALQLSSMVLNDLPECECREKVNNYMGSMKQNCYRLIRLVNNLIDITKIDTGYLTITPEECNIVSVIEDITITVKDYVENKGIGLTFDTEVEEIMMVCDPDKIERIMLNLLSNAIKFTDSPGQITVKVWNRKYKVFVSVRDTGIGVPEDKGGIIFDRFQQVDRSLSRNHEGSGIGLSLVKSLVEMHGGSIRLNSSYHRGSEFIIELPLKNYLDEKPVPKNNRILQSDLEKVYIEFSDIYFQ